MICASCRNKYQKYMLFNYNLELCQTCFDNTENVYDFNCDKITHSIKCPKCKRKYNFIVDKKCETTDCPVWFFWDETECRVFARWRE